MPPDPSRSEPVLRFYRVIEQARLPQRADRSAAGTLPARAARFCDAPDNSTYVAALLSRQEAAPLAYIGGGLGTLIGADITNLDKVRGLGAPVASIGGAGTFDGIFLTGILAVLLASLYARPRQAETNRG